MFFYLWGIKKQNISVETLIESLLDAGSTPAASSLPELMKKFYFFLTYTLVVASYIFPLSIKIRTFDHSDFIRIVFESNKDFSYEMERGSKKDLTLLLKDQHENLLLRSDLSGSELLIRVENITKDGNVGIRVKGRKRFDITKTFILHNPYRVVFDVKTIPDVEGSETPALVTEGADSSNNIEISDVRSGKRGHRSIEVICIDPGHGGSDLGAVGAKNTREKDITLKVSKKLKKLIELKLGVRVVMTRQSDVEVALDSRVAKANNQNAQLFLSVHVNSSYRKSARGPETYFVSLKATDKNSMQLAMKENDSFNGFNDVPEDDDLKMILWSMAQAEHIRESSRLADYIQNELNVLLNTRNRGVKQAPFIVLMRASMPAVLIEIAFVSNKYEENRLLDDSFLEKVAGSIYSGVSKYIYYHNSTYK